MADLIDRQAALDALEKIDCSDGVGVSALKCDAIDDAVTAIKALPSAQQWIPVSERLPEEEFNFLTQNSDFVMCSCDFGQGRKYVRTYIFWDGHFWNGPGIVDRYVKAWQPLPEPWKGER